MSAYYCPKCHRAWFGDNPEHPCEELQEENKKFEIQLKSESGRKNKNGK